LVFKYFDYLDTLQHWQATQGGNCYMWPVHTQVRMLLSPKPTQHWHMHGLSYTMSSLTITFQSPMAARSPMTFKCH